MMIYIEKGHAMGASLTFRPDDVKVVKDPSQLPEVIRGYQVHITTKDDAEIILQGRADEHIEFHGTVAELHKLKSLIDDSIAMIDRREAGA